MSERSVGSAVAFGGEAELRGGYLIRKEEIELSKKLGEGAFGAVFRGKCRGANVAVKVPSKDIEEDQLLEFKMEVNTMASISHPRLAMLLGENRSRILLLFVCCSKPCFVGGRGVHSSSWLQGLCHDCSRVALWRHGDHFAS